MAVKSIGEYEFEPLDAEKNFHGNILTYWNWVDHLMFCAPICIPFPPDTPLKVVLEEALPGAYGYHPEWKEVDFTKAQWILDGKEVSLDPEKSLADNGFRHKSAARFTTPGLSGVGGVSS